MMPMAWLYSLLLLLGEMENDKSDENPTNKSHSITNSNSHLTTCSILITSHLTFKSIMLMMLDLEWGGMKMLHIIIGASVSEPPLVDSTDALSR